MRSAAGKSRLPSRKDGAAHPLSEVSGLLLPYKREAVGSPFGDGVQPEAREQLVRVGAGVGYPALQFSVRPASHVNVSLVDKTDHVLGHEAQELLHPHRAHRHQGQPLALHASIASDARVEDGAQHNQ
jgi:hypothetical protein